MRVLLIFFNIVTVKAFTSRSPSLVKSPRYGQSSAIGAASLSIQSQSSVLSEICAEELTKLQSGSDIRGMYFSDEDAENAWEEQNTNKVALLTPTISFLVGYSFAKLVQSRSIDDKQIHVCIGRDPRDHGKILSKYCCLGAQAAGAEVYDVGLATTPAMFELCRSRHVPCDGGIMVTASHLPKDRNGMKFFTKNGGFSKEDVQALVEGALNFLKDCQNENLLNNFNLNEEIKLRDFMSVYATTLKEALEREVPNINDLPLKGLKITFNAGNGSGFFFNKILQDLGADVKSSIGLIPDSDFPLGVPNPEDKTMVKRTIERCEEVNADIGIMLDTDADRCGFVVPHQGKYEPLNRNRLIALLSKIFSTTSPGCSIVTDSVTSEGLETFIENDLGLTHVRYLKGYANVISKARELTESGKAIAEMAIETSGHCAMRENGYLDDGTYTAVKVIGLLARQMQKNNEKNLPFSLLDLIKDLKEMPIVEELRMTVTDGSIVSTTEIFSKIVGELSTICKNKNSWEIDSDNLEGIRIRTLNTDGGFFMLRKSLHDPLISLQIEGDTKECISKDIIDPLKEALCNVVGENELDMNVLHQY